MNIPEFIRDIRDIRGQILAKANLPRERRRPHEPGGRREIVIDRKHVHTIHHLVVELHQSFYLSIFRGVAGFFLLIPTQNPGILSAMKYGINLLLWGANIGEDHYKLLDQIKAWGFDGVEIPTFGPDEPRYKKLGAKLKDIGLQCTTCIIVQKETNPLDPSPAVRQASVDFLKQMIDHNHIVGSTMMMGPFSSPVGGLMRPRPNRR